MILLKIKAYLHAITVLGLVFDAGSQAPEFWR